MPTPRRLTLKCPRMKFIGNPCILRPQAKVAGRKPRLRQKGGYVRLLSHKRAQQAYGVSVDEFNNYGRGGANQPPKPNAANLALNQKVTASSIEIDEPSRSAEDK